MREIAIRIGNMTITRAYASDDLIWGLPEEKRHRKLIADAQRDLLEAADNLARTPYAVRG